MKVCLFGGYDRDHPRNRVMRRSLESVGVEVRECHDRTPNRVIRIARLAARFHRMQKQVDLILVGASGHLYMPAAWVLGRIYRKPVALDAFVSYHECWCEEPGTSELQQWAGFVVDWTAVRLSDLVMIDTKEHSDYLTQLTGDSRNRIRTVPVGSDVDGSPSGSVPQEPPFRVLFAGSFLPLHGAETICDAARLLRGERGISIEIIGGDEAARQLVPNHHSAGIIRFHNRMSYKQYAAHLRKSHLALGVFGVTPKTQRVIPCKVYDALAAGVPVVTADVPAVQELLRHGENAWLVPAGDAGALAEAIRTLRQNPNIRARLAEAGLNTFRRQCAPQRIGTTLRTMLESLVRGSGVIAIPGSCTPAASANHDQSNG